MTFFSGPIPGGTSFFCPYKGGSTMSPNSLVADTGDTAWLLTSAALVLMMTPALAFFYGGLVRKKNMLSVLMQCFMLMAIITLEWVIVGYSMSFGPDIKGWIGDLSWIGLKGVGLEPYADYSAT